MAFHNNFVEVDLLGGTLMSSYHKEDYIKRFRTGCCALAQISLADSNTIEEIESVINDMRRETVIKHSADSMQRKGGEKAVFVVTMETEKVLVENLTKLGFQKIYEFHRRDCYPKDEMLSMWILSWE